MKIEVPPRDTLRIKRVIDSRAIDRVAPLVNAEPDGVADLTIDLSSANFIDHDSLLFLGAIIAERRARDQSTRIALPDNNSVLDFVTAWRLPQHLTAIGRPSPVFTAQTSELLRARARAPRPRYVTFACGPNGETSPLTLLRSLAITPVRLTQDPWADATAASRRVLLSNFQNVLRRTIGKASGSQLADVVREAVLNASAHPRAHHAATSIHFRPSLPDTHEEDDGSHVPTEFQFAIWDDGEAIAETLRHTLQAGLSVTSQRFGEEGVVFRVLVERVHDGYERLSLTDMPHGRFEAHQSDDAVLLTAAAFMLGVSSDPDNTSRRSAPDARVARRAGGVGLAIIRQVVLDSNRGRIEYRSGYMRMTVKRSTTGAQGEYDFEIGVVPENVWHIRGNLITVTMPLRLPR